MKFTVETDVYCSSGFYCMRNGKKLCNRLGFENNAPYCEVFYPYLDTDLSGNVVKCALCLIAERKERLKR